MVESGAAGPICVVVMPSGPAELLPEGTPTVDVDHVYSSVVAPAIEAAGMEPVRIDGSQFGGTTHTPAFERFVLADVAVVEMTNADAHVLYALGVRDAVLPNRTAVVVAAGFEVAVKEQARVVTYRLDGDRPADPRSVRDAIVAALETARSSDVGQMYRLADAFGAPEIERLRTDRFRDRVAYDDEVRERLVAARAAADPGAAVDAVRADLGRLTDVEAGAAIDVFLSYRDAKDYEAMVAVAGELPAVVRRTPLVREQLGFALNRLGRRDEAERVLVDLIAERGPSSETNGILGRVHKDRWQDAVDAGEHDEARRHLARAIETYLAGFEADWRDAYPGINAITLMELADPPDDRRTAIAPVVEYSARRRVDAGDADYWDHATLLESAVLADDRETAEAALESALSCVRASWEPETTLNNLRLILGARRDRGDDRDWYGEVEQALADAAGYS